MSQPVNFPSSRLGFSRSRSAFVCAAITVALLAGTLLAPESTPRTSAAGAAATINADALDAMLGQLKQQQDQMSANQTKIETQLAALKEELRQVKIYSARAGSGGRR